MSRFKKFISDKLGEDTSPDSQDTVESEEEDQISVPHRRKLGGFAALMDSEDDSDSERPSDADDSIEDEVKESLGGSVTHEDSQAGHTVEGEEESIASTNADDQSSQQAVEGETLVSGQISASKKKRKKKKKKQKQKAAAGAEEDDPSCWVGKQVILVDLNTLELNGRSGTVDEYNPDNGRFGVSLSDKLVSIKPGNVTALPVANDGSKKLLRLRVKRLPLGIECGDVRVAPSCTVADLRHVIRAEGMLDSFGRIAEDQVDVYHKGQVLGLDRVLMSTPLQHGSTIAVRLRASPAESDPHASPSEASITTPKKQSKDESHLPYGGDVQAAMKAGDREAIKAIFAHRKASEAGTTNDRSSTGQAAARSRSEEYRSILESVRAEKQCIETLQAAHKASSKSEAELQERVTQAMIKLDSLDFGVEDLGDAADEMRADRKALLNELEQLSHCGK